MSRLYEMRVSISGFDPAKKEQVIKAANREWCFGEKWDEFVDAGVPEITNVGEGYLGGGESDEAFSYRLARAVMLANDGPCKVVVDAAYLEDPPTERFSFGKDYYEEITR